jgi:carboxyl-terminal processing protease
LTAFAGDSASSAFSLKSDDQVNEAIKYLADMNLYKKAITAPTKKTPAKSSSSKAQKAKKK